MRSSLYALAGSAATALASVRGFNYASQSQTYDTFVSQFQTAAKLVGADDFTSARLYTMIQDSTTNTVISAIPAAIATNTTLLLGLWASEDQAAFDNELTALKNAISQYGSSFADLVVGISVGSEDLYRNSPTGIAANSGYGQEPDVLVDYIKQVRSAIASTSLSSKPVGHVDTWNDFVNGSNSAVVAACDFLGLDEYPYYQTTDVNDVNNGSYLFFQAYDKVEAIAGGKPIWITETGWPVSGSTENQGVPSVANAEIYWQGVACELESRGIDFWWYILADSGATPSFGVTSTLGEETPLYNLACNSTGSSSSSSSATDDSKTSVSSVAQATTPSTAAASTTVAKGTPVPSGGIASGTGAVTGAVTGAASGANSSEPTVYVTDVVKTTVTTCPVGHTLTTGGSTTVLASPSVITTTYSTQTTISTNVPVSNVVYVTDVIKTTVTTCPVGHTLTTGGSTTVLASPSVITTTYSAKSTVSTKVPVSSVAGAVPGVASVGTGAVPVGTGAVPVGTAGASAGASGYSAGGASASTLASSWAASQTPGASATGTGSTSSYTGAATKMDGSMAALAVGAVVAVLAL